MPRPKDVHAGALVIKTRGKKKYVYEVRRIGRKVSSVYLGPYYDKDVLLLAVPSSLQFVNVGRLKSAPLSGQNFELTGIQA